MNQEIKSFDTNSLYVGGNGMFIQYHDVVKPVYLYAVLKLISSKNTYGLPVQLIKNLSAPSLIEWYIKRRYVNPFSCLDYQHQAPPQDLDKLLHNFLCSDGSIYKLAPPLNIRIMMDVYRRQHMKFPIFIYSKEEEPYIKTDIKQVFQGITTTYLFGDLKEAISKCDHNFTYIFSDIETMKAAADILLGTYSHILLSRDYRYNYKDHYRTTKYDLYDVGVTHPFLRIGLTQSVQPDRLLDALSEIITIGGKSSATNRRTKTNPRS